MVEGVGKESQIPSSIIGRWRGFLFSLFLMYTQSTPSPLSFPDFSKWKRKLNSNVVSSKYEHYAVFPILEEVLLPGQCLLSSVLTKLPDVTRFCQ